MLIKKIIICTYIGENAGILTNTVSAKCYLLIFDKNQKFDGYVCMLAPANNGQS